MLSSVICSSCRDDRIVTDPESGEIVCGSCGFVISDKIEDDGPEWRTFTFEEAGRRIRTGDANSLARHDRGLTTIIGRTNRDSTGRILEPSVLSSINRLRIWDIRTQARSSGEKGLRQAFTELNKLKNKMSVNDSTVEKTAYIYRKASEKRLIRGRTIVGMLSAALYIACRESGYPKTLTEVSDISNMSRKELARSYRLLVTGLDLKVPLIEPFKFVNVLANRANLSEKTKRRALELMSRVMEREISAGKDPMGLAAAVLYLACVDTGESRTQQEIAEASGVTEVTVRNRYRDLRTKIMSFAA